MTVAELTAIGSQPIRADAPSGDPARDTAEFGTLQNEIRKLELPDAPAPDWGAVVDAAADILGTKSKDLLVAAYLAVGLLERDGFPGLATGLQVLRDIVSGQWETCYPEIKRLRGRAAAFEWLAERGAPRARRRGESGGPSEPIESCLAKLAEVHELLADKLDGGASLMSELRTALEETKQGASRPASAAPSAAPSAPSAAASAASAAPASVTSPNELEQALTESRRLLRSAGEYLRTNEPTNPLAYRLPRFSIWLGIKQLPPNQDGKTAIPPPQPPDIADRLNGMLGAGQWAGVLQETEGRMASAVLWLDLHRLACAALEGLGPDYKPAADAVCAEVAVLLQRLPDLPRLKFANDTPIASPETRAWIEQRVLATPAGEGPGRAPAGRAAPVAGGPESEALEAVRMEARQLARAKKLTDAVAALDKAAGTTPRLRDRAGLRLEAAQICLDQGQHETALALLEALDGDLGRSQAGDWEPGLCVEVIKSLLLCRQKVLSSMRPPPPEEVQRTRELLSRLARLDVVAALDLNERR